MFSTLIFPIIDLVVINRTSHVSLRPDESVQIFKNLKLRNVLEKNTLENYTVSPF